MTPTDPVFAGVPRYAVASILARTSPTLVTVDTRGKASKTRTESSPKESMVVRALVAAAILAALASCGREVARSPGALPPSPETAAPTLTKWEPVAYGLEKTCDEPAGICCYRTRTTSYSVHADGIALSCVRVAPMQWGLAPGPRVGRAP